MNLTVIITAGGIGKRMGGKVPKQFLRLNDKPVLQRTIETFYSSNPKAQLLITLPQEWLGYWDDLCKKHRFTIPHKVITGGVERYDSIKKALSLATGEIVLVHDGVRPLVSEEVIQRVVEKVQTTNGVVPVVPLKNSIRKGTKEESRAVSRELFWEVQTPQGFMRESLIKAYEHPFTVDITDDASLLEKTGGKIHMVSGDDENLKITTPLDLAIASKILEN